MKNFVLMFFGYALARAVVSGYNFYLTGYNWKAASVLERATWGPAYIYD